MQRNISYNSNKLFSINCYSFIILSMPKIYSNLLGVQDYTDQEEKTIRDSKGKPQKLMEYFVKTWENLGVAYGDLYIYNGTNFEPMSQLDIDRLIYNFYVDHSIQDYFNLNRAKEITYSLKHFSKVRDLDLDSYDNLINLKMEYLILTLMSLQNIAGIINFLMFLM